MATKLLMLAVALNAVIGQLLLKRAIDALGGSAAFDNLQTLIVAAAKSPWIYLSLTVQAFGYVLWMALISRVKLGVATAGVGGGFYVIMALSAWAVYGEILSQWQWVGIVFITIGVVLLGIARV